MKDEPTPPATDDTPLQWGETYLDRLSHEELLIASKRMYHALESSWGLLKGYQEQNPDSPFWGRRGRGGMSLSQCEQAMNAIMPHDDDEKRESQYRSFYRYATDLLFHANDADIGSAWMVCDGCGNLWGSRRTNLGAENLKTECPCGQTLHPITWDDLAIKPYAE